MVEHRKYLPHELDYVLSRVAAGWKFETIAKAFKQDFASHWGHRLFTKKQVQYIKNTYRRPPGTIQPYNGPIPDFPPSPLPKTKDHTADLQATIKAALKTDHHGRKNKPMDRHQQTSHPMAGPSRSSAQPSTMVTGAQSQEKYVGDGGVGLSGPENPYVFDTTNLPSLPHNSYALYPSKMGEMIDPMLSSLAVGPPASGMTNSYQPDVLGGIGAQFSQIPDWTQTAPGPSTPARFTGYASHLDADPDQALPSLEDTLLSSAAPDQVLSGEPADQLLRGPAPSLERILYGDSLGDLPSAQNETPQAILRDPQNGDAQAALLEDPVGCSLDSAEYTDSSGWWYNGLHDSWCRIPNEHRHDYDGGIHFRHYESYNQSIRPEQNDHVIGYLLGLCSQLQTQHQQGVATCLHQSCEEARHLAQELADAALPEGHGLRQAPLRQPHPMVIRLLSSLNDRLPEGYVYDPISERVVRSDMPNMSGPLLFRDELAAPVDHAIEPTRPQQDQEDLDQKNDD